MKDYQLFHAIQKEVAEGRVRESKLGDLSIFKYNEECSHNGFWNETNRLCRGIIFRNNGELVARPLPKFFNLNEEAESSIDNLPQLPFVVEDKLDGCFQYETPILLADGSYKSIGEIVNHRLKVQVMGYCHQTQKLKPVSILDYFNNGHKDNWLQVITEYRHTDKTGAGGHGVNKLQVTSNHHFWDGEKYKPITEFKPNDTVYCYDFELTNIQKSMIFGSLLGDSCISKTKKSGQTTFCGGQKDKDYTDYKKQILGDLSKNDKPIISGFGTKMHRYRAKKHNIFSLLRKEWYPKDKKVVPQDLSWLNNCAIAFWYMDDGSRSHNETQEDRALFHTNSFSKTDCERLAQKLELLYGVETTVYDAKGWTIRVNAGHNNSVENFWKAIAPYIIPCMEYKLPEKFRNCDKVIFSYQKIEYKLMPYKIFSICPYQHRKNNSGYDIKTETKNYISKGILVHNSCGIGYLSEGSWRLATPGSMVSDQAARGTTILARYDMKRMPIDVTPIFEVIYPENRIVVDYYGQEKLILLAVMEYTGKEWHWSRVDQLAEICGFERPQRFSHDNLAALPHRENSEGYVIRFENNFRVKVKSPWYVQVHRLLNYMTPKNVIELIRGREYRAILEKLPPDLQASMDDIRAAVQTAWLNHKAVITSLFNSSPKGDRKTFALWAKSASPTKYLGALFSLLDQREIDDFIWKIVLEEIKDEQNKSV